MNSSRRVELSGPPPHRSQALGAGHERSKSVIRTPSQPFAAERPSSADPAASGVVLTTCNQPNYFGHSNFLRTAREG